MARKKDDEGTKTALPVNDAWTGMLAVSLLALIAASALLYLDWSQYSGKPPSDPQLFKVDGSSEAPPTGDDGAKGDDGAPPPDDAKKGPDAGKKGADAGKKGADGAKKDADKKGEAKKGL